MGRLERERAGRLTWGAPVALRAGREVGRDSKGQVMKLVQAQSPGSQLAWVHLPPRLRPFVAERGQGHLAPGAW